MAKRKPRKRKSRLRVKGNDRFFMMLARDVRRRWYQYGENVPYSLKAKKTKCVRCRKRATQWDHIDPVGRRFYCAEEIGPYIEKMLYGKLQPMCGTCNRKKGDKK